MEHQYSNGFVSDFAEGGLLIAEYLDLGPVCAMDPAEEGDELRSDLVKFNAALNKIERNLYYSKIIEPLLVFVDVPPSDALLARIRRQVACNRCWHTACFLFLCP